MTRPFSRRRLLAYAAAGGATAVLAGTEFGRFAARAATPGLDKLSAARVATTLARAQVAIRPHEPKVTTIDQIRAFEQEYVPHLAAAGLVADKDLVFPRITADVYLKDDGSLGFFHILGESACSLPGAPITFNARLFSPDTPWGEHGATGMVVSTIAHELGHSNQVSCAAFDPDVETTTQMVAMDVLAGMAMEDNTLALPGFLELLYEFADDFVLGACLLEEQALIAARSTPVPTATPSSDNYPGGSTLPAATAVVPDLAKLRSDRGLGWYQDYLGTLPDGAIEQARWAHALDYWVRTDFNELNDIVVKYGQTPYQYTMEALANPKADTRPLPLGQDSRPLRMSSTRYVLSHLTDLVAAYQKDN